jgi:hypothetical protein
MLSKVRRQHLLACVAILVLASASYAAAQRDRTTTLVMPTSDGTGFCAPFACATTMQQVFDAHLFPQGIRIEALEFFHFFGSGVVEPARYRIILSTTRTSSTSLTTDYQANRGARQHIVGEWIVTTADITFTKLTLPLDKPYTYAPAAGNLLLEIQKDQTANHGDGVIYADGSVDAPGVAYVSDGTGLRLNGGLTVGFVGRFLGR